MLQLDGAQGTGIYAAEAIKEMCLEAGADDVGLVDIDTESLQKEREGLLYVYPLTRSIISIIVVNNRDNTQSPARYMANEEFHQLLHGRVPGRRRGQARLPQEQKGSC